MNHKQKGERKMKYLTLIILALMATSAQADFWDNCTAYGGTIITANSYGNDKGGLCNDPSNPDLTNNCNGKRFCQHHVGMGASWWSCFTWCESIGGKFASLDSLCPNSQTAPNVPCPNWKNKGGYWNYTSMGWGNDKALIVKFGEGVTSTENRSTGYDRPCVCEE